MRKKSKKDLNVKKLTNQLTLYTFKQTFFVRVCVGERERDKLTVAWQFEHKATNYLLVVGAKLTKMESRFNFR